MSIRQPFYKRFKSTEERLEWCRNAPTYERHSASELRFDDPFSRNLMQAIRYVEEQCSDRNASASLKALREQVSELWELRAKLIDVKTQLSVAYENYPLCRELFMLVMAGFRKSRKRARSSWSVGMWMGHERTLSGLISELDAMYANLTPAHMLLQEHFRSQVLSVPRSKKADNILSAEFYAPLYELRDMYFREPSKSVLAEYLREHEQLMKETYYREVLCDSVDEEKLKSLEAVVDELSTDLEVAVLYK